MPKNKKVIKFPKEYRQKFEPEPDVVKELKILLKQAKKGQLRAFAVAMVFHDSVKPDGEVSRAWVAPSGTRWALDYAIHRLEHGWRRHEYDGLKLVDQTGN